MAKEFQDQISSALGGDRAALGDLLTPWRPLLWLQARALLSSDLAARVDPSDVVQEGLAQAVRDLSQFRGRTQAEWVAWLRTIVSGQAAKTWRHHMAAKRAAVHQVTFTEDFVAAATESPVQRLIDTEEAQSLARAIAALPEVMREVVVRRVFDGEPFDTVAAAIGRTPGATRVLWTRALRQLRQQLYGNEPSGS